MGEGDIRYTVAEPRVRELVDHDIDLTRYEDGVSWVCIGYTYQ